MSQNFAQLVQSMNGQDTINGWDVLVSYDEVELNALLAQRAAALKLQTSLSWTAIDQDPWGGPPQTVTFNIQLLPPTMKFLGAGSGVEVKFGISGTSGLAGKPAEVLPSGLVLTLTTSLVNVEGTFDTPMGWEPVKGAQTNDDGWITILESAKPTTHGICIDFSKYTAQISETTPGSIFEGELAKINSTIKTFLEQHFVDAAGLRLCLAAVSNASDDTSEIAELLHPAEFCFTVASGALLTWIGLRGGSNNGTRPSVRTTPAFAPSSQSVSPIPQGSTASVIFSEAAWFNLFIKPTLEACTKVDPKKPIVNNLVKGDAGINVDFFFSDKDMTVPQIGYEDDDRYMEGFSMNISESKGNIRCSGSRPTSASDPVLSTWNSATKTVKWKSKTYTATFNGPIPDYHDGTCDIVCSWKGSGTWHGSTEPANCPNLLSLNLAMDPTLGVTVNAHSVSWWDRAFGGGSDAIPSEYSSLQVPAPEIALDLSPLDYFLTTNILLPGQKIFIADAPVPASSDIMAGLAIPRDVILTGNIASSAQPSASARAKFNLLQRASNNEPSGSLRSSSMNLDSLKEAYLAFPRDKLLGDQLILLGSSTPELDSSVPDFLTKHGYGSLVDADFFNLWGTSWDEVMGGDRTSPTTSVSSQCTTVDLRLFAGTYIVSEPLEDVGKHFFIHPTTGRAIIGAEDLVPQQLYDAVERRIYIMLRTADGRQYSLSFQIVWDDERLKLGTFCKGTVKEASKIAAPFKAYVKGFQQQPEQLMLSSDIDVSPAAAIIGMIGVGVSILNMAYTLYKSCKDKRKEQAVVEMKENYAAVLKRLGQVAVRQAQDLRSNAEHRGLVNDAMERSHLDISRQSDARLVKWIEDNLDLQDSEKAKAIMERFEDSTRIDIKTLATPTVSRALRPLAEQAVAMSPLSAAVAASDLTVVTEIVIDQQTGVVIESLNEPPASGGHSYVEANARRMFASAESESAAQKVEALRQEARQNQSRSTQIEQQRATQEEALRTMEAEEREEQDPERKEKLQKLLDAANEDLALSEKQMQENATARAEVEQNERAAERQREAAMEEEKKETEEVAEKSHVETAHERA